MIGRFTLFCPQQTQKGEGVLTLNYGESTQETVWRFALEQERIVGINYHSGPGDEPPDMEDDELVAHAYWDDARWEWREYFLFNQDTLLIIVAEERLGHEKEGNRDVERRELERVHISLDERTSRWLNQFDSLLQACRDYPSDPDTHEIRFGFYRVSKSWKDDDFPQFDLLQVDPRVPNP
jgi:hypothetical protein